MIDEAAKGGEAAMQILMRRKEIESANILHVEVGTNGPQGGDAGHGSRSYLKLTDKGGTAWKISIRDEQGERRTYDQPLEVEIILGGDAELDTFLQALKSAVETLEQLGSAAISLKEVDL